MKNPLFLVILPCLFFACLAPGTGTGLDRLAADGFAPLHGKRVGLVINQTSVDQHGESILSLLERQPRIKIKAIFAPEHGFLGMLDAGQAVPDRLNPTDAIPIISLYGRTEKPSALDLAGIEVLVFDLQDAGARYYTYASTLTRLMEAAAEQKIEVMVLDRPNPLNGLDLEGPILQEACRSFVGLHPIPIRHGLTLGELALMINNSGWLESDQRARLTVVAMSHWDRAWTYEETGLKWIPPSPNLPDLQSTLAYPGTCLLEGTNLSEGRGTTQPFCLVGAPWVNGEALAQDLNALPELGFSFSPISFTPVPRPGASRPKFEGRLCHGVCIQPVPGALLQSVRMGVELLQAVRRRHPESFRFLESRFIDRLYGSEKLRKAIEAGREFPSPREQWLPELQAFEKKRRAFLLY